jgi:hypothetical protein
MAIEIEDLIRQLLDFVRSGPHAKESDMSVAEEIAWFQGHSTPAHICGWRTPSGHTIKPSECAACADNQK